MNSLPDIAPSDGCSDGPFPPAAPQGLALSLAAAIPPASATQLHGRQRELEALSTAFARVGGGEGLVLLVSGNSGAGKTSLVHALRRSVVKENGYFIEGKFNQYQRDIPLFAIRQAIRQLALELAAVPASQQQRWKEWILEAVGDFGRLLTDLAPELEAVLGVQPPVARISPREAPHRFAAVLRSFLGVFCQAEHPVVLFIDDWQWADAASLAVLRQLQVNKTLRYLLVIASYRDEEVDASHPLAAAVEELHRQEVPTEKLEVRGLGADHLQSLLAAALPPAVEGLEELAERFHAHSGGNPFFAKTLLEYLHSEGEVWFDAAGQTWRWSPAAVADAARADDVVRLFVRRLDRLPLGCRELLSLGACIGNRFDLETLSLVSEQSSTECRKRLAPAVDEGVLEEVEESRRFVFQHDRVQQAAHALLVPAELPAVRLRIGRLLVSQLPAEQLQERILEVADHWNAGRTLIGDDADRLRLVQLNVAAGERAWAATAYKAALEFYRIAGECLADAELAETFWRGHHEQALALYKAWAESEFLEGERGAAERCIREAVARARTPVEEADALCVLIVHYTLLAKYPQAIDAGRRALAALGIVLPEADFDSARDAEIERVRQCLRGRSAAALRELPRMTDPVMLTAARVLTTIGPPCYRSQPRLWSVIVPKIVGLTLQHGHIPQVGYSHTGFGGLLAWVANDYATAREFGELAEQLMGEVFQSASDRSVFSLMMGSSLRHWLEHLSAASGDYAQAWETGLRSGNLQYAAYATGHNMYCRFFQGVPLPELIDESQRSLEFSRTHTNEWTIDLLEGGLRVFQVLAGSASSDGSFEGTTESDYLHRVQRHQNLQVACIYRVLKASSLLVLGEYQRALALSDQAATLLEAVGTQGLLPWPEHVFTRLLLLAAVERSGGERSGGVGRQAENRREIDRLLSQLRVWANQCPANYRHKWSLAEAEVARLDGRATEAVRLYERASEEARAGSFTQWEAMAHERAAALCDEVGDCHMAQVYWQAAYGCYHRWGAHGKLRTLEAEFRSRLACGILHARGTSAVVSGPAVAAHPLADVLDARVGGYFQALAASAACSPGLDEQRERASLIEELTQATVNLREEVAERKRIQAELQRHREQLAREIEEKTAACQRAEEASAALLQTQKTEAIGRLAGGVAHDFNNLLTVINGGSELLMSMIPADDPKRPLLDDIHGAGERAANLTRQLLAFSRKQILSPRVLDLNTIVSRMERILLRLIGEDVEFRCDLGRDLWPVTVDPGQIEQVIINLAINARDALPSGGRIMIKTSNLTVGDEMQETRLGAEPGSYVVMTVSDSGCGMPPEVVSRLFEPFFTTKEIGKGTGLGLATVFGIVKQSNGLIDVQSEIGSGTTFRILLPAEAERSA
ncbi:AAA family ATPase [Candidatus Laterigemmans baculatus]|uniref:AAA family ATPase n=1 Tax=Candidatus Laterigemmans baculatus TaxID=2770505 RepID=UPI0013DC9001|nr:AAA family ATPase [Candidatus Laterigemmans baculatus]